MDRRRESSTPSSDITMFYRGGLDGGGGYPDFRMIPLDGHPHDPQRALQYTYMGYTVGRWEGDTLVLDSIGFTDETWLGRGGKFHSDQMRVVEKFTRTGQHDALRGDGRGSGRARRAVGHESADPAAREQPGDHRGARKLHGQRAGEVSSSFGTSFPRSFPGTPGLIQGSGFLLFGGRDRVSPRT